MDELKVLRPVSKTRSIGSYHWVHIDACDGKPLCGAETDEYVVSFQPETWDSKTQVCGTCRANENHYSVNTLQSGQIRRYGPTEYIYDVTDWNEPKRDRAKVLAFCMEHVYKSYLREDMPNWASPRMKECTETKPSVWRYHVFCESTH